MTRYSTLCTALLAAFAVIFAAPPLAGAGCPGCEEYTLDIPEESGGDSPAPAAPAPAAPAPVAPAPTAAPTETVPTTTVPAPTAPVEADPEKKPKPGDTDPDPIPREKLKPVAVDSLPAVTASQAANPADSGAGGVLPLALGLGAIAVAGLVLGLRDRNRTGER